MNLSDILIKESIDNPPAEDGWYILCGNNNKRSSEYYFKDGKWYEYSPALPKHLFLPNYTHYLRPATPADLEKIIGDAWDAAVRSTLKRISLTFLDPDNQKKVKQESDRVLLQAIGETIESFPMGKSPRQTNLYQ